MVMLDGVHYLTVGEACAMLGVKPATIYAYVSRGVLRSYKQSIKRQRLYREDEVRALMMVQPSVRELPAVAGTAGEPEDEDAEDALPRAEQWIGER